MKPYFIQQVIVHYSIIYCDAKFVPSLGSWNPFNWLLCPPSFFTHSPFHSSIIRCSKIIYFTPGQQLAISLRNFSFFFLVENGIKKSKIRVLGMLSVIGLSLFPSLSAVGVCMYVCVHTYPNSCMHLHIYLFKCISLSFSIY